MNSIFQIISTKPELETSTNQIATSQLILPSLVMENQAYAMRKTKPLPQRPNDEICSQCGSIMDSGAFKNHQSAELLGDEEENLLLGHEDEGETTSLKPRQKLHHCSSEESLRHKELGNKKDDGSFHTSAMNSQGVRGGHDPRESGANGEMIKDVLMGGDASLVSKKTEEDPENWYKEVSLKPSLPPRQDISQQHQTSETISASLVQDNDIRPNTIDAQASEDHSETIHHLREALEKATTDLSTLKQTHHALLKAHKETQRKKQDYFNRLASLQSSTTNAVDDDHLTQSLLSLRYTVKNFILNEQWAMLPPSSPPKYFGKYQVLSNVTESWRRLVTSRKGMELLIEGFVWRVLRVYCFGQDLWTRSRGKDFEETFDALANSLYQSSRKDETNLSTYHQWRSLSASFIQTLSTSDTSLSRQTTHLSTYLTSLLSPLVIQKTLRTSTLPLTEQAVKLDCILRRQRAVFRFTPSLKTCPPRGRMRFCDDRMSFVNIDDIDNTTADENGNQKANGDSDNGEDMEIDLILGPGICKYGDEEGENYDAEILLLKAEVLLKSSLRTLLHREQMTIPPRDSSRGRGENAPYDTTQNEQRHHGERNDRGEGGSRRERRDENVEVEVEPGDEAPIAVDARYQNTNSARLHKSQSVRNDGRGRGRGHGQGQGREVDREQQQQIRGGHGERHYHRGKVASIWSFVAGS